MWGTAYTQHLRRLAERAKAEGEERRAAAEAEKTKARLVPLEERLRRLLDEVPDAQQREGLPISLLQPLLRGRRRGNAPAGHIGKALAKIGWTKYRHSPRHRPTYVLWYPPGVTIEEIRGRGS